MSVLHGAIDREKYTVRVELNLIGSELKNSLILEPTIGPQGFRSPRWTLRVHKLG